MACSIPFGLEPIGHAHVSALLARLLNPDERVAANRASCVTTWLGDFSAGGFFSVKELRGLGRVAFDQTYPRAIAGKVGMGPAVARGLAEIAHLAWQESVSGLVQIHQVSGSHHVFVVIFFAAGLCIAVPQPAKDFQFLT